MSSHSQSLKIFSGTSHPELAQLIARRLGLPLGDCSIVKLPSGEVSVNFHESVRESDVYIVATASSDETGTNGALMELCIMAHTLRIASARRITAVIPHFPYARQDKKDKSRAPITAKLVANMLVRGAGIDHVILYAEPTMLQYLKATMGAEIKNAIIVSPDAGGAKRASSMAASLDLDFALFHKERKKANEIARMVLVGNVEGKTAILIDDMADTCGTLALAAKHLLAGGAKSVLALVTHGILSGPAVKVLNESPIDKLIVTNSIPQKAHKEAVERLKEVDISHVLAEAVRRSFYGESISVLFNSVPYTEASAP
ncbi:hypothetical protein MNV49_003416 [Pseudohyphozyma bogoriensis]|nr:hypothetical protein MNV49_003416 [Pseudohyphozyma bogoriensis]